MSDKTASAIVVGGGPAGLTAAIALAAGGIETVLAGKRPSPADNRTTACSPVPSPHSPPWASGTFVPRKPPPCA